MNRCIQCKIRHFFSTGRAAGERELGFSAELSRCLQTKRPSRKAGRPFFGTMGLYFSTIVTLAPSGMPASSRSSEGFSTLTLFKDSQPEKAPLPMLVTLSGIVTLVKEEHFKKAQPPILLTLFGIVMLFKEEQPVKAKSPMLLTLSGIVMLVKDMHQEKAPSPMLLTLSGIVMFVKDSHSENAYTPMLVTLFEIVMLVKDLQP